MSDFISKSRIIFEKENLCFQGGMVEPCPFPHKASGPLVVGLWQLLGHCLMIRPSQYGHSKRVIVKFGHLFLPCDSERENFAWFIEVLRVSLSAMDSSFKEFYSPKFWVYFPWVVVGEPWWWLTTCICHFHICDFSPFFLYYAISAISVLSFGGSRL